MSTTTNQRTRNKKTIWIMLSCAALLLLVMIPVMLTSCDVPAGAKADTMLKGVTINGIDVSGLSKEKAMSATASIQDDVLTKAGVTLSISGNTYQLSAKDLGLATDYEDIINQALAYGHTGTADEQKQAADKAKAEGMNFTVHATGVKETIAAALLPTKQKVDKPPVDATAVFTPNGHTADGQPYTPDPTALADANSKGKDLTHADLVKIDPADAPNPLRFKYWQNDHYVANYIPPNGTISRFVYTPDVKGQTMDANAVADQIIAALQSGSMDPIAVTLQESDAAITLDTIKKGTQLVASWSSSFGKASHYNANRNWNVSRMSSFINGNVIQPGGQFSVNTTAGPRNDSTARTVGWKKAAGIENGGYTQQVGGGVCQLGSTTFNAAIRANLKIVSSTHHTIPSDYIPLGLDATLSTPAPDLVLENDNTMPVYIVSYINPADKNVTVEVYGQPVVDPAYGDVILDFTNGNIGRYGSPVSRTYYGVTPPDQYVFLTPGENYIYAEDRLGTTVETFKLILSLDGKQLNKLSLGVYRYPVINGAIYINSSGPDASLSPTPSGSTTTSPTPTPSTTATPTPTPSASPSAT